VNLLLKTILISCCLIGITNLTAQQRLKTGVILKKIDSTSIESAHIINLNTNYGTKSNVNGAFTISVQKGDTLLVSFIGYQTLKIIEFKNLDTLYLEQETFTLELYTVLPYKNFKEFKEAFVNLKLKDTVKHKMNPSVMALVQPFHPNNINGGISFSGPISSILAKFNKRIKDKQNYLKLIARDNYQAQLSKKFNPQFIKRITELKNNLIVSDFMTYCDFTDKFIEVSSDYELIDQVFVCYEEYKSIAENCHSEQ